MSALPDEMPIPTTAIFPADSTDAAHLRGGWRIAGASRRGRGHEYDNRGREDDFAVHVVGDAVALIALADGVGNRQLAAYGASAAVRGATAISDATLLGLAIAPDDRARERASAIMHAAFARAFQSVQDAYATLHVRDASVTLDALESTLQVWIVAPRASGHLLVAGAQIGDGALFARRAATDGDAPAQRWQTLLAQQVGATNNEVTPLNATTVAWWQDAFFCHHDLAVDCLLGMTDGTADDLRPLYPTAAVPDPDPFLFVDEFGALALRAAGDMPAAAHLLDFLGYHKRQSLDDRTVVLLFKEGAR